MDLRVGQACVVVDADEDHLPTGSSIPIPLASVSVNRMSDPLDAPEALGIDVEQTPRRTMLVAVGRSLRLLEPPLVEGVSPAPESGKPPTDASAFPDVVSLMPSLQPFERSGCISKHRDV